jgi:hypothetical protein
MKPAVDVHERLAVMGEPARLGVREALWVREATRDLAVAIDFSKVIGRRDQREIHRPALAGRPRFDQLDVLGRRIELLEVVDRLVVGRQLVVGARAEAEDGFGGRDAVGDDRRRSDDEQQVEGEKSGAAHAPSIDH